MEVGWIVGKLWEGEVIIWLHLDLVNLVIVAQVDVRYVLPAYGGHVELQLYFEYVTYY